MCTGCIPAGVYWEHTEGEDDMAKRRQVFVYDSEEHADIARWLDVQDNKSKAIREAIRSRMSDDKLTPTTLRSIIRDELACITVTKTDPDTRSSRDEDPELAEKLDSMF